MFYFCEKDPDKTGTSYSCMTGTHIKEKPFEGDNYLIRMKGGGGHPSRMHPTYSKEGHICKHIHVHCTVEP